MARKDNKQRREPHIEALLQYADNIIATLREPFLVLDKNLKVISANHAFYATFEVKEKDTVGQLLSDLAHGQWNIPKLIRLLKEIIPGKKVIRNYEIEHKFEQIGERTMVLNARQVRAPKKIAGIKAARVRGEDEEDLILLAIEDITDRKHKETQYRTLIENLPQKVFLKDRDSVYISCNENYAKDLNIKADEIEGKTDHDFFPTYLAEKYRQDDKRVMESGKTENIEEEFMVIKDFLRGAQKTFVNTVKVPVRDKDGNVAGLFGLFWDITERKNMEEERTMALKLQQETNMLRQSLLVPDILESKLKKITDAIVQIFDADFCRIWLIRPGDLCEKGCIHANVKEGPHICRFRNKCLHLMASSGRYTHIDGRAHARVPFGCYKIGLVASGEDHKFLTNDVTNDARVHNHKWARELGLVSFAGYQLKIPQGETIGVMALFSKHPILETVDALLDSLSVTAAFVVQQEVVENELRKVESMKISTEVKSKFASMVSHELRSPMAVIKESIDLVMDGLLGDVTLEQKDILNTAKNNIDRLGRLINNVLDFQKIGAGKMEFDIKENDINKLILTVSEGMHSEAANKGLGLVITIDEEIPRMQFDEDRIIQVVTNLLSNAIKFTQKGSVSITAKIEDNMVHVIVEDTGPGIQAEDMHKLFQTFGQIGGGMGKQKGGTGLGLAISKEIIQAHNGRIWAESQFGKGSEFHFTLPIKERRTRG